MSELQHTIASPASFSGKGLHTGKFAKVSLLPASENSGIVFKKIDGAKETIIKADCFLADGQSRGTTLDSGGNSIATIEHLMAAITASGIDNLVIEVEGEEIPILDGSSKLFMELIRKAGLKSQGAEREYFVLNETIHYYDEEKDVEITAMPYDGFAITVMVDYDSDVIGKQFAHLKSLDSFEEEISPAKTFCFLHEVEGLYKQGLIQGGELNCAIVVAEEEINQEKILYLSDLFNQKVENLSNKGVINKDQLRFENEFARHKLLDIIGDLGLAGTRIKAKIIATKPGHAGNVAFARMLKTHIKKQKQAREIPTVHADSKPVLDLMEIQSVLPHRSPFLLVDKIIEMNDITIVGVKNVTFNEPFFTGHFPQNPVMPGVLQIEAMAQTGGILAVMREENRDQLQTFLVGIDDCKFRQTVQPGDTLIIKMVLTDEMRRGFIKMKGVIYVGQKVVAEATLTAKIFKP